MKLTHKSTWRVSFLDMISLILAFFIMLFSMMEINVQEENSNKVSEAPKNADAEEGPFPAAVPNKPKSYPKPLEAGDLDLGFGPLTDQPKPALNLDYLHILLKEKVTQKGIFENMRVRVLRDRLILSLPEKITFETAKPNLSKTGHQTLKAIVPFLLSIDNRIAVMGHTDPRGISKTYSSNWTLSLDRAVFVKKTLNDLGYDNPMLAIGCGDGRYNEDPLLTRDKNFNYGRRVDLVIYPSEKGALVP